MKKLAILSVLMFASVMMFAQQLNKTTVTQTGNTNNVDVYQTTTNGPNKVFFYQHGNGNDIDAWQEIVDDGSVANAFNYSKGAQTGYGNDAMIDQDGHTNRSYLTQSGNSNKMVLDQYEAPASSHVDNYAKATQSGNSNKYFMDQEGHTNIQKLYQSGNFNDAQLDQTAILSVNKSYVYQTGDKNKADLDQIAVNNNVGAINYSYAKQKGYHNWFWAAQSGEYAENTSDLLQSGNANKTRLFQETWYHNVSKNTETGNNNYIKVIQGKWGSSDPAWF